MIPRESDLRSQIVEIGHLMYTNRWVAANDGNISARLGRNRFLVTPGGVSKGKMKPEHLVIVDETGARIEGDREPTSEIGMHLVIYREREDVGAVVHAHPPFATGFAVAGRALNLAIVPEVIVNLGAIPLASYGQPGSPDLAQTLLPLIPCYDAILLANHGAVTYGVDLDKALAHMETVEHVSRIAAIAETLGGPRLLGTADVDKLILARTRYNVSPRLPAHARPISREEGARAERDPNPAGRVSLHQIIRAELELRLANLLESAGMRFETLKRVSPHAAYQRLSRQGESESMRWPDGAEPPASRKPS